MSEQELSGLELENILKRVFRVAELLATSGSSRRKSDRRKIGALRIVRVAPKFSDSGSRKNM